MNGRILLRVLSGLVLIAAIIGIGVFAFNAGLVQGMVKTAQLPAGGSGNLPYLYNGMPYGHIIPFFGLGCFGPLVLLFLFLLALSAFRHLFWGDPRLGHLHSRAWNRGSSEGLPPMFAEWHRRAHERPEDETAKKE
jgi:hypothetical protein